MSRSRPQWSLRNRRHLRTRAALPTSRLVPPLLLLLLISGSAFADYEVSDFVFGNGGATRANASYIVSDTFGQPAIGYVSGATFAHEVGFWHRWVATIIGIDETTDPRPLDFWMGQNYPNPFNPRTELRFTVPTRSRVTMNLYDATGRQVKAILAREFDPGLHTTVVYTTGLPTGIYYCRMHAGSFVETKKLVIVK